MSSTEIAPQDTSQDTCSATNTAPSGVVRQYILLRCFARAVSDNCYIAECIDLDISVEGVTEIEAKVGLQEALYGYLNVILEGQDLRGKNIREFILRPSPLTHRIRYYLSRLKDIAISGPKRRTENCFYPVPTHSHCC
jgi:hypothetical protein